MTNYIGTVNIGENKEKIQIFRDERKDDVGRKAHNGSLDDTHEKKERVSHVIVLSTTII